MEDGWNYRALEGGRVTKGKVDLGMIKGLPSPISDQCRQKSIMQ